MDELIDSLILDCNNAVRHLTGGNYIAFCNVMTQLVQKIANVRKGIKADMDSKNRQIEELKEINNRLVEQVTGLPVINDKKDGAE